MIAMLGNLVLLIAGLVGAYWGKKVDAQIQQRMERRFRLWMICSLFVAVSALFGFFPIAVGSDFNVFALLISNLAYYVSLPIFALLLLAMAKNWEVGGSFWGRVLLGLIVAFEFARQFQYGVEYTQLVAVLSVLLLVGAAVAAQVAQAKALLAAIAAGLAVTFACSAPLGVWPVLEQPIVDLLCGLLLLLATRAIDQLHKAAA